MTNRYVVAHTPVTMNKGHDPELEVKVGDTFPIVETPESLIEVIILSQGGILVDFGVGRSAYSEEPDEDGKSIHTWFNIVDREEI